MSDVCIQEIAQALHDHEGPVLVDLDETLYLRNSTEDFLDAARPALIAFLLVRMLDLLRPWRLTGGDRTRDGWRVGAILLLMPWSLWRWRQSARTLGAEAANRPLIAALRGHPGPVHVVTLGFRPIVAPLIAALGIDGPNRGATVAMRWWRPRDRRDGKLAAVVGALGSDTVARSLVITDSADDRDLLDAAARPLLRVWPQAAFRPAFQSVYVPGLYITRIKRPGCRFIYRSIVSDELSIWVLASVTLATAPLQHVVGLVFLAVSFWSIYEGGYVDNDRVGLRFEKDPNLSDAFFERSIEFPAVQPWLWAAGCGAIALVLLRWPQAPVAADLLTWSGVLVFTHLWFRLYNRLDKRSRIWFFGGLQMLRALSFAAVVSITPVGAAALLAHALARWVPYYSYRMTRTPYDDEQVGCMRLLLFLLLSVGVALLIGWEAVWTPVEFVLLGWFAFKARRVLARNIRAAHLISRDGWTARTGGGRPRQRESVG